MPTINALILLNEILAPINDTYCDNSCIRLMIGGKNERDVETNVLLRILMADRSVFKDIKTRCDLRVVCSV